MLHYAYSAVKKFIHACFRRSDAHVIDVPLPFLVSLNKEIMDEFRQALMRRKLRLEEGGVGSKWRWERERKRERSERGVISYIVKRAKRKERKR